MRAGLVFGGTFFLVFVGCASVAGLNDFEIVPCPTICVDASVVDGASPVHDAAIGERDGDDDDDDGAAPVDASADVVVPPAKPTTLKNGLPSVQSLAVAPDAIYLATTNGGLRIALPVTAAAPAPISQISGGAHALAWDATDSALIWVDDHSIGRWTPAAANPNTDLHPNEPQGIDVVSTNGRALAVYATAVTSYQVLPTFTDIHQLAQYNSPHPSCIATDGTSVFWIDEITLNKSSLTGDQFPFNGGIFVGVTSLAVDDQNLYLAEPNQIVSVAKGLPANAPIDRVVSNLTRPFSLLADGAYLYWLTTDGSLQRAAKTAGSAVTTLATGGAIADSAVVHTRLVAADATYIYWANPTDGTVNRIAK